LGLVLLALGGDSIVKGASGLGRHLRLSPFATGLLLVAFGTSLPELAVNARAAWTGSQALALGNAVGSNIVNFGLTLGLAALIAPLVIRWRALAPMLLWFLLTCVLVVGLGWDGALTWSDGLVLLLAFVVAVVFAFVRGRQESPEVRAELEAYQATRGGLVQNLLRVGIAIVVLYYGAKFVIDTAPLLGSAMGMSPLLVGLIPVAIGTALPEIAAAIVAARRGQGDVVAGHVIGSSLFNLTVVVGGMATFRAVPLPASFLWFEVPAAFVLGLMLYPMLKGDMRISKREGGVLVAAFVAWLVFEFYQLQR
jgi:cation:H+ antiporter